MKMFNCEFHSSISLKYIIMKLHILNYPTYSLLAIPFYQKEASDKRRTFRLLCSNYAMLY